MAGIFIAGLSAEALSRRQKRCGGRNSEPSAKLGRG
jgi:hypothetical protein